MQTYELEAWLGDNHGLTDDQIAGLLDAAGEIGRRYPDPDDADDRETALTVAYRLLVEPPEDVVAELGADLSRARLAEHRCRVAVRQAALSLVDPAAGKGERGLSSEGGFASAAGVDRMAVRSWLGKR